MTTPAYVISYILDNQPMSTVLHQDQLTLEDARRYVLSLHSHIDPSHITDIQLSRNERSQERDTTPGHYRQP
ncbi:hypothetical protein [Pseudomonas nitroreducens]|uniref:Uncharacterized protein n=1 Tax=Pseudomonas nitroreducens TaxID=46680 RepID=A0A246F8U3_PSENT|nr:hypothetical protein [Pseudomonas nitroreducens]OWP50049.1 hypothetical protein CEG18_16570 [Pseudomonas nitroreducens]